MDWSYALGFGLFVIVGNLFYFWGAYELGLL
jgi:hypothetical protein